MDKLDISKAPPTQAEAAARSTVQGTAKSPLYSAALALEFFRTDGTPETKPAGKAIFTENEKGGDLFSKSARMYLLLEGEVGLMIGNKSFGEVKQGEIFGELAVIAAVPRSATAMAKTDCKLLSLDEKQFHAALQKTPEFALMLMSIMGRRLRESIAKLAAAGAKPSAPGLRSSALDKKMLALLAHELEEETPKLFDMGTVIMSAGAVGAFMYVVEDGLVAISIADRVVERLGPGGIFGELALVDRTVRAATATAETICSLFSIGRNDFIELLKSKPMFAALLLKSTAGRMQYLAHEVAQAKA